MYIQNYDFYHQQLQEQISLLILACESFDKGNFIAAKQMSAIIRTLIKDPEPRGGRKTQTISLLKSLGVKESMKFYNTGYEAIDPEININLVGIATVPTTAPFSGGFEHLYLPILDDSNLIDCKWLTFTEWWESKIIVSKTETREIIFTRKKISLTMAEQDGGVHIDQFEKIDKDYRDISQATAHLFVGVNSDGAEVPIKNLQYALVRQIAHELIVSIIHNFNLDIQYSPTNKTNLRGVPPHRLKQGILFAEDKKHLSSRTTTPFKSTGFTSFKTPPNAAYVKISF